MGIIWNVPSWLLPSSVMHCTFFRSGERLDTAGPDLFRLLQSWRQEVWDMVYKYIDFVKDNGYFEYRRNEQSKYWMYETINEQLRDSFYHNPTIEAMLADKESQVLKGNLTSFVAAKNLLDTYFAGLKN